jgi:hypothetical protein
MRSQLTGAAGVAHRAAAGRAGDLLARRPIVRLGGGDDHNSVVEVASEEPCGDVRCGCGALLARRTEEGIELKCRRCRRSLLIRLMSDGAVTLEDLSAEGGRL